MCARTEGAAVPCGVCVREKGKSRRRCERGTISSCGSTCHAVGRVCVCFDIALTLVACSNLLFVSSSSCFTFHRVIVCHIFVIVIYQFNCDLSFSSSIEYFLSSRTTTRICILSLSLLNCTDHRIKSTTVIVCVVW